MFKEVPEAITLLVSRLFCRYVEKKAREQLWKTRCERTVGWKEKKITREKSGRRCTGGNNKGGNPERTSAFADET